MSCADAARGFGGFQSREWATSESKSRTGLLGELAQRAVRRLLRVFALHGVRGAFADRNFVRRRQCDSSRELRPAAGEARFSVARRDAELWDTKS